MEAVRGPRAPSAKSLILPRRRKSSPNPVRNPKARAFFISHFIVRQMLQDPEWQIALFAKYLQRLEAARAVEVMNAGDAGGHKLIQGCAEPSCECLRRRRFDSG